MKRLQFRFVSNDPNYDNEKNVLEFVECETGNMSYDEMERLVIGLLNLGLIPSGCTTVGGYIVMVVNHVEIVIDELEE